MKRAPAHCKILLLTLLLMVSSFAHAKMYKCVDSEGNVTYSQRACPQNEKTEKVMAGGTGDNAATGCPEVRKFASRIAKSMRSGTTVDDVFARFGGVNSLSKSTIGIINYVYFFKSNPDVSVPRIAHLSQTKCEARAFGSVACEDFPDEFQQQLGGCDKPKPDLPGVDSGDESSTGGDLQQPAGEGAGGSGAASSTTSSASADAKAAQKARIDACFARYDNQIDQLNARAREEHSSSEADNMREQRRRLKRQRTENCK